MKTIKFKMTCDTGFVTATHTAEEEIEVEDDATQEQIEKEIEERTHEWAMERIDFYYEIIES